MAKNSNICVSTRIDAHQISRRRFFQAPKSRHEESLVAAWPRFRRFAVMHEFLATSTSYPTVVFTVLLGVSVALGLLVLAGVMGPELFSADVDVDLGVERGDAVVEAGTHGAMEGASEGGGSSGLGVLGSIVAFVKPKNVPMLLAMSMWSLFGWVMTGILCSTVLASLHVAPHWLAASLMGMVGAVGASLLTSLVLRPLGRALKPENAVRREDLVGQTVIVDTSRVTRDFGSAKASDGGAGLVISIRCDRKNRLTRGSKALVVSYDAQREIYEVTSVQDIVPSEASIKS